MSELRHCDRIVIFQPITRRPYGHSVFRFFYPNQVDLWKLKVSTFSKISSVFIAGNAAYSAWASAACEVPSKEFLMCFNKCVKNPLGDVSRLYMELINIILIQNVPINVLCCKSVETAFESPPLPLHGAMSIRLTTQEVRGGETMVRHLSDMFKQP